MTLQGKAALVTGAATGIGRAIAERFAQEGALVAVNFRSSREAAGQLVAQIRAAGGTAISVAADVSVESEVCAMFGQVQSEFGHLDVLVNNAGWSTRVPQRELEALTDDIWNRTFDVNLRGLFYCVRATVPLLRKGPGGSSIVNVASVAGSTGVGSSMAYAAAKAGVITMTKSLARALAPEIRVNAISPGLIRTHFAGRPNSDSDFTAEELATPLKRLATVDECAEVALFLASSATAVTGQTILVDGGLYVLGPNRKSDSRT
jgi:3-oxoacyl-[acyl-carrier protein] reductase